MIAEVELKYFMHHMIIEKGLTQYTSTQLYPSFKGFSARPLQRFCWQVWRYTQTSLIDDATLGYIANESVAEVHKYDDSITIIIVFIYYLVFIGYIILNGVQFLWNAVNESDLLLI